MLEVQAFEENRTRPVLEVPAFKLKAYLLDGHLAVYFKDELDLFTLRVVIGTAEAQGYDKLVESSDGYLAFA